MSLPPSLGRDLADRGFDERSFLSNRESLLSRIPNHSSAPVTALQSQVDGLVGGFAGQATDWRSLAAMLAGGLAYRIGRIGTLSLGTGSGLRAASVALGLGAEVSAFEVTHRALSPENPNLWRWNGSGGLRQGLLHSLVTFGTLKAGGRFAQGQNLIARHLLQDSAMVLGHQVTGALHLAPRVSGSLAEQFLHAEAVNLQLGAGMSLLHGMAPGVHALERGLDLSLPQTRSGSDLHRPPANRPAFGFVGVPNGSSRETSGLEEARATVLNMSSSEGNGKNGGSSLPPPSASRPSAPPVFVRNGQELAHQVEIFRALSQGNAQALLSILDLKDNGDPIEFLRGRLPEYESLREDLRKLEIVPLMEAAAQGNWNAYEMLAFLRDLNPQASTEVGRLRSETAIPSEHIEAKELLVAQGDSRALRQLAILADIFESPHARDLLRKYSQGPVSVSSLPPDGGENTQGRSLNEALSRFVNEYFPVSQPPQFLSAAEILRASPHIQHSEVTRDGKKRSLDFRVTNLGAAIYTDVTENRHLAERGLVPPAMTFVANHPSTAELIQEALNTHSGSLVIHAQETIEYRSPLRLGEEIRSTSSPRLMHKEGAPTTFIVSRDFLSSAGEVSAKSRSILMLVPENSELPAPPVADPMTLGRLAFTFEVGQDLHTRYSEVSGDHNPVHKGEAAIVHGMATFNLAERALFQGLERADLPYPFTLKADFSGAVRPGDTLRAFVQRGKSASTVSIVNQRDERVLTLEGKGIGAPPATVGTVDRSTTPTPAMGTPIALLRAASGVGSQASALQPTPALGISASLVRGASNGGDPSLRDFLTPSETPTAVSGETPGSAPAAPPKDSLARLLDSTLEKTGGFLFEVRGPQILRHVLGRQVGAPEQAPTDYLAAIMAEEARLEETPIHREMVADRVLALARDWPTRTVKLGRKEFPMDPVAGAEEVVRAIMGVNPFELAAISDLARQSSLPRQAVNVIGCSRGFGHNTAAIGLLTGAFRFLGAGFREDPLIARIDSPLVQQSLANIVGLEILARAVGAQIIPINADTILVKRTKEWGDVVLPLSDEYIDGTARLREAAPNKDLIVINSIAFTRYMGSAPGGTRLTNIPDMNDEGRIVLSHTPKVDQNGYEETLQSMGLNHWALLQAHRPFMGPDSQSVFLTWTGGSQDYWSMRGVYGDAALGDAKISGETAATLMQLESLAVGGALGSHLVADFPAALTAALLKIPGAKPMAMIQRSVLEERGVFRNVPELAAGFVKALVNPHLNRRNPRTNIVLDAHEYTYRGEIMSRLREFHRRVAHYRAQHPDWDGKTPLSPSVTREIFQGLVKDEILNQFLKEHTETPR